MNEDKPQYLQVDTYVVSTWQNKPHMSVGKQPLLFRDIDGNIMLTAKVGVMERGSTLIDQNGKSVGFIKKKGISITNKATYLFFDGNNNQIGEAEINSGWTGLKETISIKDPQGNVAAVAQGSFMNANYSITDPNLNKVLVNISQDKELLQRIEHKTTGHEEGMLNKIAGTMMAFGFGAYKVEIVSSGINDLSRLLILELIVVLDEMFSKASTPMGGVGMGGLGGGGIGMGGFKI
ncbi:MAG: hypothetical protein M1382_00575 [Candidatus Marsarchaeota archaeon]|jgi:hypothetical protein|nr:hypothetical protein [Candidatus Marsarchaeota archaeon]